MLPHANQDLHVSLQLQGKAAVPLQNSAADLQQEERAPECWLFPEIIQGPGLSVSFWSPC